MKKIVYVVLLAAAIGEIGYFLMKSESQKAPVVKNDKVTDKKPISWQEAEPKPTGPLSFWTGEIIIGEGPNRGKIELVAHEGYKAVILTADDEGNCCFDSIPGIKKGEVEITLRRRGQPPLITCSLEGKQMKEEMHLVLRKSKAAKDGRLTFVSMIPRVERLAYQKGQELEGFTWHMVSVNRQQGLPEENDRHRYASSAIEITPSVKVLLKRSEYDLSEHYFTDKELIEMAEADQKFDAWKNKNRLAEFKTSVGMFRSVSSYDRYSIDANAKYNGGWCMSTLQLPNGKWLRDLLRIERTVELDEHLYLICRHEVVRWVADGKLEVCVTFEGLDGKWAPYISPSDRNDGLLAGKYLAVNKSNDSEFGGLLEYREGEWIFHQYNGDYGTWVKGHKEEGGFISLELYNGSIVIFDRVEGAFADQ